MTQAVKWLYLVVLAVWLGSIIFFSFVVAPTVFKTLKPEDAATLIRRIFSKYYFIGVLCSGGGILAVGYLVASGVFGKWPAVLSLLLLASAGATDLWLRQTLMPQMNVMKDKINEQRAAGETPDPVVETEWKGLHRLSVQINGAVLVCLLVLMFLVVYRLV